MTEQEVLIDIRERLVRVETKLDAQNDLRGRVEAVEDRVIENEALPKSNAHRINELEENNKYLWRAAVGAVIAAGISAILTLN